MAIREYDDEQGLQSNSTEKMEYVKFGFGNNKVRLIAAVVGKPVTYFKHSFLVTADGKSRNVLCLGRDNCPICDAIKSAEELAKTEDRPLEMKFAKAKASRRNLRYVIDRTDGKIKLMEYGTGVRDGIQALFKNEDKVDEKGTPNDYDLVIIKSKGESDKVGYQVQDGKKVKLTEQEQAEIEKLIPLVERLRENTVEEIMAMNLTILTTEEETIPI